MSNPITDHKTNECNDAITITPLADDGAADCPRYSLTYPGAELVIEFQNGPIKEAGHNGVTGEALIAVVLDRLRRFQSGKYSARENALAITKLEEALHWLHHRTRARLARGVEGTNAV